MFKVWKSIFNIATVKNIKIERFKCFLYGRLLSLLLASQIVFISKDIIHEEYNKEVSILKSFSSVNEYFITLKADVFRNEFKKVLFFNNILHTIRKLGIKCKKKDKKTVDSILNFLKIKEYQLEKMSI